MKATDYEAILRLLIERQVQFIIVGGVAGNLRGSARATFDLDAAMPGIGKIFSALPLR